MKILKNYLSSFIVVTALCLSSCGYVSDKPPANIEVYKAEALQSCKIDVDKLSEIFKEDQKDQIKCLQENFEQFTKYVRSNNSSAVTEVELNAFIRKFFKGQSESIIKGLSLIFQLNMLLLKDEADRISRTNISPLFDLLVKVNQESIILTQTLKEMDDAKNQSRFWELREKFISSITRFSDFTVKIIDKSPGVQQKLNIRNFITDATKKLGNTEISSNTLDSAIFIKKFLVGGEKEIITTDELKNIITKMPLILSLGFDFYYVKDSNFQSDADHARFALSSMRRIYDLIEFNQPDFQLFTVDQLITLLQSFISKPDFSSFKPSIIALKARIIGGEKESFSLSDLKNILDIAQDYLERNYFNIVTYDNYQTELEKNKIIYSLKKLDLPNSYDLFNAKRIDELHSEFEDIAVNIKYFRNKNEGVPFYGNQIVRSKYGFLDASFTKWGASKLLSGYGHKNADGIKQVSLLEFQTFLTDMKPILEEFKLWSPAPETFARNAILLADLFQNKSNGDFNVNINEASEYIQMILTAVKMTDLFSEDLSQVCTTSGEKEDRVFETNCFNTHFFETILSRYKVFFPRLATYVDSSNTPRNEVLEFLKGVEGFARDNPDSRIPINRRDSILIIGAMLNIESTFLRFDTNRDNIIDYKELVVAFDVYKQAIISLAKLTPENEGYAKSIFLYMASKMEIPPSGGLINNIKFVSFDKCVSNDTCRNKFLDKVEAKRLNIGKLLYYLVSQTPTVQSTDKKQQ